MKCQTFAKGAAMTADSLTEVEVGIREVISRVSVCVRFMRGKDVALIDGYRVLSFDGFQGWMTVELRHKTGRESTRR